MKYATISPMQLHHRIASGEPVNLVDVRTQAEYAEVHAVGARSIPLDQLNRDLISTRDGEAVYIICKSGGRSANACTRLIGQGLTNVVNVDGGTVAWQQAGLPVECAGSSSGSNGPIGLGRTGWIRIAGVVSVIICLGLGVAVHPLFAAVAGGLWIVMALTGHGPCCWNDGCTTGKRR